MRGKNMKEENKSLVPTFVTGILLIALFWAALTALFFTGYFIFIVAYTLLSL